MFAVVLGVTFPLFASRHTAWGWLLSGYLSVVWSLPFLMSVLVLVGSGVAYAHLHAEAGAAPARRVGTGEAFLIVQIPTIGRYDVMPSLRRVVESCERFLPVFFASWRVDIVAEETSEARDALLDLASDRVRVLFVDADYVTPNRTQRKARANCWTDARRADEEEIAGNIWVLHMDDDTGIGIDTARHVARFIAANPPDARRSKHFAQGVLTYPRQFALSWFTWIADAVRPASDLSVFRLLTGSGAPLLGAHGELLLIRSTVEHGIGWDFGRMLSITEDANFALHFATRFPGKSAWFSGRCYGASPSTLQDFVTQRTRWARGLLHVSSNRTLPLRVRILMAYALTNWAVGPLQHVFFILVIAQLTGDGNISPVTPFAYVAWAGNFASGLWMYVEGLKANVRASGRTSPAAREWAGLLLMPVYTFIEGWAGFLGAVHFVMDRLGVNRAELFPVIAKPYPAEE
jgi:hypothetical protein